MIQNPNTCTSTSVATKTLPQYFFLCKDFANGSVLVNRLRYRPNPWQGGYASDGVLVPPGLLGSGRVGKVLVDYGIGTSAAATRSMAKLDGGRTGINH